jgi:hypothetical protein
VRVVSWRLTVLLMGRPDSSDENLMSTSTMAKSCLACSGVMWVTGLGFESWWMGGTDSCGAGSWVSGGADCCGGKICTGAAGC